MSAVNDFYQNKILGSGGYGTVFQGEWNNNKVAVKRIQFMIHVAANEREEELLNLHHPNVIKLFDVKSDLTFRYYFLELCDASLDKLFLKDGDPRKYHGSMPPAIEVLHQLATGMEYIHQMGLVHGNIKPENVLIWENPVTKEVLMKWTDFGISKPDNERVSLSTNSGSNRGIDDWCAPEILSIKIQEEKGEKQTLQPRGTTMSDVFVEGLVFGYFLLGGIHLFGPRFKIPSNIHSNNPINLPNIQFQYARDLIHEMLKIDQITRISSYDVARKLEVVKEKVEVSNNDVIGMGGYGLVFRGTWAEIPVAIKRIQLFQCCKQEEESLRKLVHPNVTKLAYAKSDSHFSYRYYVLELCDASMDKCFLKDDTKKYSFTMPSRKEVLYQLAIGLEYIHGKGLVHRDIKPQNVLISVDRKSSSKTEKVLMKWADFGLSKPTDVQGKFVLSKTYRGSEGWLAPEILILLDEDTFSSRREVTDKSDVFSLGLVFGYYLLDGVHIFGKTTEITYHIANGKDPVHMALLKTRSEYAHHLILKMLEKEPGSRITSSMVAKQLKQISDL